MVVPNSTTVIRNEENSRSSQTHHYLFPKGLEPLNVLSITAPDPSLIHLLLPAQSQD